MTGSELDGSKICVCFKFHMLVVAVVQDTYLHTALSRKTALNIEWIVTVRHVPVGCGKTLFIRHEPTVHSGWRVVLVF